MSQTDNRQEVLAAMATGLTAKIKTIESAAELAELLTGILEPVKTSDLSKCLDRVIDAAASPFPTVVNDVVASMVATAISEGVAVGTHAERILEFVALHLTSAEALHCGASEVRRLCVELIAGGYKTHEIDWLTIFKAGMRAAIKGGE